MAEGATRKLQLLLQHLNAVVVCVGHNYVPIAVDCETLWIEQLSVAATPTAANGVDVRTVGVVQHLHAMIKFVNYNQMTSAVQRNTPRIVKLARACALCRPMVRKSMPPLHLIS